MTLPAAGWRALRAALLAIAVVLALGHASGLLTLRWITDLDLEIADTRLRAAMPRSLDPRIVIVDVDDDSLARIGRWPWGRDRLAALTDEIFERQHAAAAAFDMLFAEPDTSSGLPELERLAAERPELRPALDAARPGLDRDARFARALQGRPVVLGYYLRGERGAGRSGALPAPPFGAGSAPTPLALERWNGYAASLPALARAAPAAGFFNAVPDADGRVRSVPLLAEVDGRACEALALALLRRYAGAPRLVAVPLAAGGVHHLELQDGAARLRIPVDRRARAVVPYRGPGGPHGGSFEYVAAADLLQGRVAAGHLAGKLVFVGSTAPGVYDQRSTPVAEVYPGVEVHASLLSGLLDGRLHERPDWTPGFEMAQILFVAALLGGALPRLRAAPAAALALALAGLLVAANACAFRFARIDLPLASALLLTAVLYMGITLYSYFLEGRKRRSLARLFGTYVPPELVREMARDPARYDMRAENRELTIMFCDMRNFTQISENLAPEALRLLVNRFFSEMTEVIRAHRGTLDKYIGDAIMAFWGAPLDDPAHAANATRAALAMRARLDRFNAELGALGVAPAGGAIGIGIGLNSGEVCVGDMGSAMRRSYTVMGDAVNLASRIEGLTRVYGVDVLVGEAVRDAAADAATWVEVDRVRVKGKQRPVTLFTPLPDPAPGDHAFADQLRHWRLALQAYRLQHWDDAQAELRHLIAGPPAMPLIALARGFNERIDRLRGQPPPADWDGAHHFDSK